LCFVAVNIRVLELDMSPTFRRKFVVPHDILENFLLPTRKVSAIYKTVSLEGDNGSHNARKFV